MTLKFCTEIVESKSRALQDYITSQDYIGLYAFDLPKSRNSIIKHIIECYVRTINPILAKVSILGIFSRPH